MRCADGEKADRCWFDNMPVSIHRLFLSLSLLILILLLIQTGTVGSRWALRVGT